MKKSILVLTILTGISIFANAKDIENKKTFDVSFNKMSKLDAMPLQEFKKIDSQNHLLLVKFLDNRVRESILFAPEMKEKVKTLKENGDLHQVQKLNLSNIDRVYALDVLSNIHRTTGISLKHIRSNGLGYDQFHVSTSDIEGVVKKLMDTGRFHSIQIDEKIEASKFEIKPIIKTKNPNITTPNNVGTTGYNVNAYGDFYAYLQPYLDDQELGNMGSHGFFSAIEYVKTNNNLGRKVRIAVIDTGYQPHEDIDEIIEGADFLSSFGAYQDCLVYDNTYEGLDLTCAPENYKAKERDNDPTDKSWLFPALDENGVPTGEGVIAIDGHGLAVASTIGAKINDFGIVGALGADNVEIVHVRSLGVTGGFSSDTVDGIIWASGGSVPGFENISQPVDIINLSLGGRSACPLGGFYQSAIQFAISQGVTVVSAAGNNGEDASTFSPASCSGTLTVAADNKYGDISSFSNYGDLVDVSFAGESILVASSSTSTYRDPASTNICSVLNQDPSRKSCYGYISGTSFSAPLASSAIALLKMAKPELSQSELRTLLIDTAPTFNEDILGRSTRRSSFHPNAGVGNVMNALTTTFDRLFIDKLNVEHQFSEIDTPFENFYFDGLIQYGDLNKICSGYDLRWNNFTDERTGITYTVYGSNSPLDATLTPSNSEIIATGLVRSEVSVSINGYSRLGVQANSGDIFEFDLSNATLPDACL